MRRALPCLPLVVACTAPGAFAQTNTAPPPPTCRVAADGDYGHKPTRPIQVGGSPMYGGARSQRYLGFLTGPAGQALTFNRAGSTLGPDGDTMLDLYTVSYDGLDKPLTLFVDVYHFTELLAPRGFACGAPLAVGTPPPNPLDVEEQVTALAAATATAAAGPIAPIPLGDDGAAGFVLDRFRVLARPAPAGAEVPRPHRTVVVVKSAQCEGRSVTPKSVTLAGGRGEPVPPIETFTTASRFAALATGVAVPEGSLGAVFQVDGIVNGVEVRATFSDRGCAGEPLDRAWRLNVRGAELLDAPRPARPAGDQSGLPFVAVQAVIDHAGVFREPRHLGGPDALTQAAMQAIAKWKVRPASANGAPLTTPVVLLVYFADVTPQ